MTAPDAMTRGRLDELERLAQHAQRNAPGPWQKQDGCSWRRIGRRFGGDGDVVCPTNHHRDAYPDLIAPDGVLDYIAAASPDVVLRLIAQAWTALSPEPGAVPLDTPEVREALAEVILREADPAWADPAKVAGAVLAALAPHLATARRAAFRAGVEAAAALAAAAAAGMRNAQAEMKAAHFASVSAALGATAAQQEVLAQTIRAIPTPAAFAAPEPAGDALRLADRMFEMSSGFVQNGCTHGFKPAADCPNEGCEERRLHRALLALRDAP